MDKSLKELGFKVGDKVKCVHSEYRAYKVGNVYEIFQGSGDLCIEGEYGKDNNGYSADWELAESKEYYDWVLKSEDEVPEGSKLAKDEDGNVIAYAEPALKFGDIVQIKKSIWCTTVKFPEMFDGKDYVVGVYVGKNPSESYNQYVIQGGFNSNNPINIRTTDKDFVTLVKETI